MKTLFISALTLMVFTLTGCGSDNPSPPPLFATQILSDAKLDGDIAKSVGGGVITITQGVRPSYDVGFDPTDGAELRTFLQFPLTGAGGVPGNALIQSATLVLFINNVLPNTLVGTIPLSIDLVVLKPTTLFAGELFANDFDKAYLASTTVSPPISLGDSGRHVVIDVTALMREAQRLGLLRFQVRILRDPLTPPALGLIEINDATATLAPLLDVSYY